MLDEFESRNATFLGISNEEKNFRGHTAMVGELGFVPEFSLLLDSGYTHDEFERTTAYLIDERGKVLQVFPMEIYSRGPWWALINEVDRLDRQATAAPDNAEQSARKGAAPTERETQDR